MQEAQQLEKPQKMEKTERKLEKFLKFDNFCLKFDAYWDDRNSHAGEIHNLNVFYYLSDDTIQINEIPKQGKSIVLCKRGKLPKVPLFFFFFFLFFLFECH